ncbi:hypothetical protein [Companilactobacillus metriopterae]|uniref:hypothetical protein n=1 Tax=Companilactobacillus metriopterae TaxID=1909267 RepID=UPI00100AED17|nr:hypothetical protein [Companilactobacillus metriopterae]
MKEKSDREIVNKTNSISLNIVEWTTITLAVICMIVFKFNNNGAYAVIGTTLLLVWFLTMMSQIVLGVYFSLRRKDDIGGIDDKN